jgi:acylphosphatase
LLEDSGVTRTVNIQVSGRVQGVYFRRFAKNKAQDLGVKGSVRNMNDGRVEIIAQAEADNLEPFIAWCRKGPITARVDHVELVEMQANGDEYTLFEII